MGKEPTNKMRQRLEQGGARVGAAMGTGIYHTGVGVAKGAKHAKNLAVKATEKFIQTKKKRDKDWEKKIKELAIQTDQSLVRYDVEEQQKEIKNYIKKCMEIASEVQAYKNLLIECHTRSKVCQVDIKYSKNDKSERDAVNQINDLLNYIKIIIGKTIESLSQYEKMSEPLDSKAKSTVKSAMVYPVKIHKLLNNDKVKKFDWSDVENKNMYKKVGGTDFYNELVRNYMSTVDKCYNYVDCIGGYLKNSWNDLKTKINATTGGFGFTVSKQQQERLLKQLYQSREKQHAHQTRQKQKQQLHQMQQENMEKVRANNKAQRQLGFAKYTFGKTEGLGKK